MPMSPGWYSAAAFQERETCEDAAEAAERRGYLAYCDGAGTSEPKPLARLTR